MDINRRGLAMLYDLEGRHKLLDDGRYKAYLDTIAKPPVWTLYAGLTKGIREGMIVTEAQGDAMVRKELNIYEDAVERLVCRPLSSNAFSALVVLVYNIGIGAFERSTLLKELNKGRYDRVPSQWLRWNKAGGKTIRGLDRRRKAELALFLEPDEAEAIVPPDPMPQRVEPSNPTTVEVVKESKSIWVSILGLAIGGFQQIWSFFYVAVKEASSEAIHIPEVLTPFEALFRAIGANMGLITAVMIAMTLITVIARKILSEKA